MNALTYLVTRCHGLKTHLISASMFKSLAWTKDIHAFTEALLKTDYSDMIREIPWKNINGFTLERIFAKKLIERCHFVSNISVFDVTRFLQTYYQKFEVQNIRRILRGKIAKTIPDWIKPRLFPIERYSSVNFNALLASDGVVDAVNLLTETVYSPTKETIQQYESSGSLLPIEVYLEKVYAEKLMKSVETLPEDKEDVNRLIRVQFDIRNCITVLGGVIQGLPLQLLESLIIPYSFKVSATDIKKIIRSDKDNAFLLASSVFQPYRGVVNSLLASEEAMAHVEGLRCLYKESESICRLRTYSFAFILTYLITCELEERDLASIALGKEYNLPPEDIYAHLVIR